ncbi:MAG TPA: sigma-70 family RNA polymerase sigma factor [Steroidobacteraceae bacterium]|nr:sigma-70 family RNA polymerase sigma factor [Steroidobacteraceae bacterium]
MRLHEVDLSPTTLALAKSGDGAALAAFYAACAAPAYTVIRRIVPGPAADDLLQDAFLDAFRGLPRFRGDVPLGAWFRSIVVRRCYMHLRSPWQRSRDWLGDLLERLDAAPAAAPAGLALDLERALERLPPLTRLVVWLHDVEGYTHEEIAAATARTPSFSKSQLARAHARLRAWLEPEPRGACAAAAPAMPLEESR